MNHKCERETICLVWLGSQLGKLQDFEPEILSTGIIFYNGMFQNVLWCVL